MSTNPVENIYGQYSDFLAASKVNPFCDYFLNAIASSESSITAYEKYVSRSIDLSWVEAIEDCIIPIDTIIRNPGRYIRRDEDIVPIEMARDIGPEAVRHLSQHTNMIASVKGDEVTPSRILNITKEDAVDTYENRFIYTLLTRIEYFLDKRMGVLMKDTSLASLYDYTLEGSLEAGTDKVHYTISMQLETPHVGVVGDQLINADITGMSALQRIERIRKIVYTFMESRLIKELKGTALVRPPLTMTNVLKKNPNFIKCVSLWGFINNYEGGGCSVEYVERQGKPDETVLDDLRSVAMLEYVVLKKHAGNAELGADFTERRTVVSPKVVKRTIEDVVETYDMSIDEVKKVFLQQFELKEKARNTRKTKMKEAITRAIAAERENLEREEARYQRQLLIEENRRKKAAEEEERRLRLEQEALEEERLAEEARLAAQLKAEEAITSVVNQDFTWVKPRRKGGRKRH